MIEKKFAQLQSALGDQFSSLDKKLQEAFDKNEPEVVVGGQQQQQFFLMAKKIGSIQQAALEVQFLLTGHKSHRCLAYNQLQCTSFRSGSCRILS